MSIKLLKKQGGFTLLELLIVIVIIGILALLIIPNITSAPKKARDTQRKTDISTIRKGLEEYFVNSNSYPDTLNELTQGSAPIIKQMPVEKKGTWPAYTYNVDSGHSSYTLSACLENNQDNGENTAASNATGAPTNCSTRAFIMTNGN